MDIGRRNAFKTLAGATLAAATAPQALARSGEIESRIARLNGCDIHYRVAGSGPTVVLLHGWPQTSFAAPQAVISRRRRGGLCSLH